MYLELADGNYLNDNYLNDNEELLPMVDPTNGEIVMINADTFAMLTPEEQLIVESQAPLLLMKMQEESGEMGAGFFENLKEKVGTIVGNFREKITGDRDTPILPWKRDGQSSGMTTSNTNQEKFSMSVEPTVKPWFARPEFMIGGGVILLGGIYLATRKK